MFRSLIHLRTRYSSHIATILFFLVSFSMAAQSTAGISGSRPEATTSLSAKALTSLPDVAANSTGELSFHEKNLRFTTDYGHAVIANRRIIAISSGDERVETGGTPGKLVRIALPYGSGLALGALTHKKVGLLTIEFLDDAGEYHGAVFELATQDIAVATAAIHLQASTAHMPQTTTSAPCPASQIQPDTVRVDVIAADDLSGFPAEDRVLLYERLVHQLETEKTITNVYRAGDPNPASKCAEFTVTVSPSLFNKGDQAVRASVGPLGHFVGTTKLSFHLTVAKQDGSYILDEQMKKSEGSDSDSLNITKAISKTILKNLKKSRNQLRKAQLA